MSPLKSLSTLLIGSTLAAQAAAGDLEVWSGWMNLVPCSEVEWTNDGIFGTPSPTLRTGPQELHGSIVAHVPDNLQGAMDVVVSAAQQCGIAAAAVTTAAAIVTDGAGGWPAFTSTFYGCMQDQAADYGVDNLQLNTWTECNW